MAGAKYAWLPPHYRIFCRRRRRNSISRAFEEHDRHVECPRWYDDQIAVTSSHNSFDLNILQSLRNLQNDSEPVQDWNGQYA